MKIIERDWTTRAGLRAVVVLVNDGSHRCGYVGVPKGHPLYGAEYNQPCAALREPGPDTPIGDRGSIVLVIGASSGPERRTAPDFVFDVHGSLTYSGGDEEYPIPCDPPLWWFGFDCAHNGDKTSWSSEGHEWTEDEVAAECERLASQIVDAI